MLLWLALLLALAALLRHAPLLLAVACFLAVVSLAGRILLARQAAGLMVRRRLISRAFVGDRVEVQLTVQNRGALPQLFVELADQVPAGLVSGAVTDQVLSLGAGERQEIRYGLACVRRGVHLVGPWTVRMGDPFGLVQRRLAEPEPAELLVYPRVVALDRLGLPAHSALALLAAPHRLLEDPSRIRGIRDYQPTDSPRRIHWTASARLGRLSVKQYQPAFARDTLLCLDLSPAGYEGPGDTGIEMAIVVAASLAVHIAERERLAVGLATRVREGGPGEYRSVLLPPAEGLAHAATILEALARARPVSAGGLAAVLDEQRDTVRWGTTVVGITGSLSPELADALVTIKARGHPTSCIVAQPPERFTAPQLGTGWPVAWPRGVALHRVWTVPELASVA